MSMSCLRTVGARALPSSRSTGRARALSSRPSKETMASPRRQHALPPQNETQSSSTSSRNPLEALQNYDFLSAGVGALAVTSYCVMRGQEPLTALGITAAATVVAVVANELLLDYERKQQQ